MHPDNHRTLNGVIIAVLAFSLSLFIALGLVRAVAQPQWESVGTALSRLTTLKKGLRDPHGLEAIKRRLMAQQDSLSASFNDLSRHFGETKDLPGALRMLIEKANAADIQFVKMQPHSEGAPDKEGHYPIVLEMTASYNSLGRFISSLETVPHMVHVDRLAITAARNAMLDIRIQVTCYL